MKDDTSARGWRTHPLIRLFRELLLRAAAIHDKRIEEADRPYQVDVPEDAPGRSGNADEDSTATMRGRESRSLADTEKDQGEQRHRYVRLPLSQQDQSGGLLA